MIHPAVSHGVYGGRISANYSEGELMGSANCAPRECKFKRAHLQQPEPITKLISYFINFVNWPNFVFPDRIVYNLPCQFPFVSV